MLFATGIGQAADIPEKEENPISSPQRIEISSGSATISGWLGKPGDLVGSVADTDFYEFYCLAGDVVTLDIDGGWGGARNVNTFLAVFQKTDSGITKERENKNGGFPADEGSVDDKDARIDKFRPEKSGYYIVGVTTDSRAFNNDGSVRSGAIGNGDYQLIISGITPQVQQINIEIKPGRDEVAPINPRSNGKIPVALLSSNGFDAMNVDTKSLTFGRTGEEMSLSHCARNGEDVNGDGRLDLVCHFENQQAGWVIGDLEAVVRGKMKYGTSIEGRGRLKVIPE
jgi:hypothetical protein